MNRNVLTNTAVVNTAEMSDRNISLYSSNISEYKIGHTTYTVETHFNLDNGKTINDVIERLILRDINAA